MTRQVALLRAINLRGRNRLPMADLRAFTEDLGLADPKTVLASGNLVFGSGYRSTAELEALLETEARERLGLDTDFFVRTAAEWARIIDGNPFSEEAIADPSHLLVLLLKEPVASDAEDGLREAIVGRERVRLGDGAHAYAVYPDGIGRSKLTTAVLERELGTSCTGRNWNTAVKLRNLAGAG